MSQVLQSGVEVEIQATPDRVWSVVSDYASDTRWRKGIVEMTPDVAGAPRVGTNVREVLRLGGRTYTTDTTVTGTGPGMSYRFAGAGTSGTVRGGRSVRAGERPGSARFRYDVELEPDALPRAAAPVLAWWLRHSLRRDVRRLRGMLEQAWPEIQA
ncbi:MAG TPA: SRPBCC family protein [Solirubrobacteraceae bacterium]|jgi:hypothetical protein|nr:SRPBCC family protein [Solirubrobacteraceae bacterium]